MEAMFLQSIYMQPSWPCANVKRMRILVSDPSVTFRMCVALALKSLSRVLILSLLPAVWCLLTNGEPLLTNGEPLLANFVITIMCVMMV